MSEEIKDSTQLDIISKLEIKMKDKVDEEDRLFGDYRKGSILNEEITKEQAAQDDAVLDLIGISGLLDEVLDAGKYIQTSLIPPPPLKIGGYNSQIKMLTRTYKETSHTT